MITLDQLRRCMPLLSQERAEEMLPHLCAAITEFDLNTSLRLAAFIAQLAHESGELRWMEEIASGRAYEGRRDLGNTLAAAVRAAKRHGSTPGKFYKGHGPIQVTGYTNHKRIGEALGVDAVNHPELLATPEHGFRAAGVFWKTRKLNEAADREDFRWITKRINGGLNGWDKRVRYYQLARGVFGLEPWEDKG